jgi:hypothetical protein
MMTPKTVAFALSGMLILAGVLIEGSDQNPWNLVLPYLFAVGVLEAWRADPNGWLRFLQATVVCGVSVYGAVWTLGPGHAAAPWASLVYVGLAGAVFASVSPPTPNSPRAGGRDG